MGCSALSTERRQASRAAPLATRRSFWRGPKGGSSSRTEGSATSAGSSTLRDEIRTDDADGQVVDFHSLRVTFNTLMARAGVSLAQRQALMRHSDPKLTANVYTRLEAAVVTIAFEARIVGGTAAPTPEALEIMSFAPEVIPWSGIAFKTTMWALRDWIDRRRPDLTWPTAIHGH